MRRRARGNRWWLIHGQILADAFYSLRAEPCIANNFRVDRRITAAALRGVAEPAPRSPFGNRRLMAALCSATWVFPRAHIAGHSYGSAIALQCALDAP